MNNLKGTCVFMLCFFFCGVSPAFTSDEDPIPDFGPEGPADIRVSDSVPSFRGRPNESVNEPERGSQFQLLQAILKRLDLSGGQKDEIMQLMDDFRSQGDSLRAKICRVQDTVETARLSESDPYSMQEVRGEIAVMLGRSRSLTSEFQQSILNILTNDQREKFNQIRGRLAKRASEKKPI